MPTDRLIIFTRYPQPGKAKTRLIPALGAVGAAALQRHMTEHTIAQVQPLLALRSLAIEIWFAASSATESADLDRQQMQDWLGTDWIYRAQVGEDLGDRMSRAMQTAFAEGSDRVVIIGTDCPELDSDRLTQAFDTLTSQDLTLGIATDGGYYLIGLRRFIPELFLNIDWGTSQVLEQTLSIAQQLSLPYRLLDPLTDIDYPEDLVVWQRVQQQVQQKVQKSIPSSSPQLSIIIPVLNEATVIQSIFDRIQHQVNSVHSLARSIEIIIVDGGSQDQTVTLAKTWISEQLLEQSDQLTAIVTTAPAGRAQQMNAGARIATGEILLFLHADTQLPDDFMLQIEQTLMNERAIAGAFELRIAGEGWGLRWIELTVKWRSHFCQLPYGDQAIFLKAATFQQLAGFADMPIMEDFELVQRLKTLGKVAIAPAAVQTSQRRWQSLGVLQTTLINQLVILGYFFGIPLTQLARLYRRQSFPKSKG